MSVLPSRVVQSWLLNGIVDGASELGPDVHLIAPAVENNISGYEMEIIAGWSSIEKSQEKILWLPPIHRFIDQSEVDQMRVPKRRIEYMTGRWLLGEVIGVGKDELSIKRDEYRAPHLVGSSSKHKYVTISHADDLALAASCNFPIGIDHEPLRSPRKKSLIREISSDWEAEYLELNWNVDPKFSSFNLNRIWTVKEAILKVLGCGMNLSLSRLPIGHLISGSGNELCLDVQLHRPMRIWIQIRDFSINRKMWSIATALGVASS